MKALYGIRLVLMLVAVPAAMNAQAREERAAPDPFGEAHVRLMEAVDRQLGILREQSVREAAAQPAPQLAARIPGEVGMADGRKGRDSHERLRRLGVDAARIFDEEGLAAGLLRVAEVESNYEPLALSPKGARGLWQLMPATAAGLGLRVDAGADERIDPQRATRAAARHLRELYERFGEWRLALAAYNAGEGRVERAIAAAGTRDYARLAEAGLLPEETRKYVRAVLGTGVRE